MIPNKEMVVASIRKRAGSSQAPPPTASVVYLIYNHSDSDCYNCSLYALNIAAAENGGHVKPLPEPLFRFKRKHFAVLPGFGALDSKICIIGEWFFGPRNKDEYELDVYVFDTRKPLPPPTAVDDPKTFLIKGPRLNAPKVDPIVVTFDGRIYAFPSWFSRHINLPSPKCEVLNLELGSWVPLPDPPLLDDQDHVSHSEEDYYVDAYTVHNSNFVASTPKGLYCLNLTDPIEWRYVQLLGGVSQFPFTGEVIRIDEKYFAIFESFVKVALCEYDFDLERGLVEEKNSVDLHLDHQYIHWCRDYKVVHLGENKLCVIRCGLNIDPYYDHCECCECRCECCECSNFISYDIFKVRDRRERKKKSIKACTPRFLQILFKVRERRRKKNNRSKLVHCASSTFSTNKNPRTFFGSLDACFPMMNEAE